MLRFKTAACAALCFVAPWSPAWAQSQSDVAGQISTALPDNNRGQITASGLRGVLNSLNGARGQPNGIAGLGTDGRLPASQLPSSGDASGLSVTPNGGSATPLSALFQYAPTLDGSNNVKLGTAGPTIGKYTGGKYTDTPNALTLPTTDQGSTGDISGMSATPTGGAFSGLLSDITGMTRPQVANNAALKTLRTPFYAIQRNGFAAAGDGGSASYVWSGANCPAADDGTQVQPTWATGCWVIDYGSIAHTVSPLLFEAVGATDDTAAIRKAVATGKTVDLCGKAQWTVTGDITRNTNGQIIKGCGKDKTTVLANGAGGFTTGVMVNAANTATIDQDYTVFTGQPDTNVKANLITYPPLFYLRNCPRFRMKGMGVYRATVGIDMKGNSGGANIEDLQISAFNIGIDIDGTLDTVRLLNPHWFPFFMSANHQQIFFNQGAGRPIGINSGRMDDLKIHGGLFIGGLAMNFFNGDGTGAAGGNAGPTFAQLTGTNFDTFSGIAASGTSGVLCTGCLFTVGSADAQPLSLTGAATATLTGSRIYVGASINKSPVLVGGDGSLGAAYLNWTGGTMEFGIANDIPMVSLGTVAGQQFGQALISGVAFKEPPHSTTRSTAVILGGSNARLVANGNSISDFGSGSGTFINLATDGYHRVIGNVGPGWNYKLAGVAMPDQLAVTGGGGRYFGN